MTLNRGEGYPVDVITVDRFFVRDNVVEFNKMVQIGSDEGRT